MESNSPRVIEVDVPAEVAYDRLARPEDQHLFRAGVHRVTHLDGHLFQFDLTAHTVTAELVERRLDTRLRWQCADWTETVRIEPLSERRALISVVASGTPALLAALTLDLAAVKRLVEPDPVAAAPLGHFANERPLVSCQHHSNWREDLVRRPDDPAS